MASSLCRRLTLTTLLQTPNPFGFSQSLLHRTPPLSSITTSKLATPFLTESSRFLSDSITTLLSPPQNPQRSNLSLLTSLSTPAVAASLIKPPDLQSNRTIIIPAQIHRYPIRDFAGNHLDGAERRHHSTSAGDPDSKNPAPEEPELRHQEITGPTVERDTSALADETRQVLDSLRKSVYDLSVMLALLGTAHLGLGAWIAYSVEPPREVTVQGLAAFALPFTLALLMRRTLKPLSFFSKMEDQGRLQILTLSLQSFKALRTLLLRIRVVAVFCLLGASVGSISTIWVQ